MLKHPQLKYIACPPVHSPSRMWPDRVLTHAPRWLSTDLRDGNQALLEPMDVERKLRLFDLLVRVGFKEIEVGFPSASQTEFDFVRRLINERLVPGDVTVQALTPARPELIARTFDALRGAAKATLHLYNATSPVMRQIVLGLDEDATVALALDHALLCQRLAAQQPDTQWTFQYSPEMFSGTELGFSLRVVDAVTDVWRASAQRPCIINLPSTVEHSTPNVFADQVEWMHRHMARREGVVLSVHPHNDRGTGTAAAELALMAGAERVEGCLFGNGERTGNLDLVNVALNLYTQGVHPRLDFSNIDEVRRTAEACTRIPVHPRHPYVGELVYTSFSGTHQDAIRKVLAARQEADRWNVPYLPIDPKDLGRGYEAVVRVNSQSGKGGMAYLLEQRLGVVLPRGVQIQFSRTVQANLDQADRELSAQSLWTLFEQAFGLSAEHTAAFDADMDALDPREACAEAMAQQLADRSSRDLRVLGVHKQAVDGQVFACVELQVAPQTVCWGVGMQAQPGRAAGRAVLSAWRCAQQIEPSTAAVLTV